MLTAGPVTRLAGPVRARALGQPGVIHREDERAQPLLQPHRACLNIRPAHAVHRPRPQLPAPAVRRIARCSGGLTRQRDGAGAGPSPAACTSSMASAALTGSMPSLTQAGTRQLRSTCSLPGLGRAGWAFRDAVQRGQQHIQVIDDLVTVREERPGRSGPRLGTRPQAPQQEPAVIAVQPAVDVGVVVAGFCSRIRPDTRPGCRACPQYRNRRHRSACSCPWSS